MSKRSPSKFSNPAKVKNFPKQTPTPPPSQQQSPPSATTTPAFTPLDAKDQEIIRLRTLNQDMDHQIRELLARTHTFDDAQFADIERRLKEHVQMADDQAEIIKFLREEYHSEFAPGATTHQGKTFAKIVLYYLKAGVDCQ